MLQGVSLREKFAEGQLRKHNTDIRRQESVRHVSKHATRCLIKKQLAEGQLRTCNTDIRRQESIRHLSSSAEIIPLVQECYFQYRSDSPSAIIHSPMQKASPECKNSLSSTEVFPYNELSFQCRSYAPSASIIFPVQRLFP